jgi:hypothetical protein
MAKSIATIIKLIKIENFFRKETNRVSGKSVGVPDKNNIPSNHIL